MKRNSHFSFIVFAAMIVFTFILLDAMRGTYHINILLLFTFPLSITGFFGIGIMYLWIGFLVSCPMHIWGLFSYRVLGKSHNRYRFIFAWEAAALLFILSVICLLLGNAPSRGGFIPSPNWGQALAGIFFVHTVICAIVGAITTSSRNKKNKEKEALDAYNEYKREMLEREQSMTQQSTDITDATIVETADTLSADSPPDTPPEVGG